MKKASEYLRIPDGKRIWFHDFLPHFHYLVLDPIKRFPLKMDDTLIGFVFMSCSIDYLSGFWWGESKEIGMVRRHMSASSTSIFGRGVYTMPRAFTIVCEMVWFINLRSKTKCMN